MFTGFSIGSTFNISPKIAQIAHRCVSDYEACGLSSFILASFFPLFSVKNVRWFGG